MKSGERAANIALAGLTLAPLVLKVDPNINVILTACLTVFVGCYRSVKPTPPSETMSNEHAMRFPLVGSAMLLSLFLLFKATLLPVIRRFLPTKWNEDVITWRFPHFRSLDIEFTRSQAVAAIPGTIFCVWYVAQKHWLANNVLGLAFCIQGIEMLSLGSFKTGAILLVRTLLFPTRDAVRPFSMLGLGDIVIPAVIGFLAAHCIWNGEVKPLLEFDESKSAIVDTDVDEKTNKIK
ncbi:Peptidase A22B, signal peptide peptidase [Cynara cardunculus var. scolymus]|uniref:Peptidase A22B, signal peptide peptidase n=1 Tax=Cynara cardunculus var. scolymus TaxID=59895 RepID=A0A103YEE0_CYNCS|nr:Peptidase A22B, signal peptide peptidase [Cynara cardunculus var. scolymus]